MDSLQDPLLQPLSYGIAKDLGVCPDDLDAIQRSISGFANKEGRGMSNDYSMGRWDSFFDGGMRLIRHTMGNTLFIFAVRCYGVRGKVLCSNGQVSRYHPNLSHFQDSWLKKMDCSVWDMGWSECTFVSGNGTQDSLRSWQPTYLKETTLGILLPGPCMIPKLQIVGPSSLGLLEPLGFAQSNQWFVSVFD